LTEEAIQYIIRDFISHPGRAKPRNITLSMMMVKSLNESGTLAVASMGAQSSGKIELHHVA
jgi:hypothetical protein